MRRVELRARELALELGEGLVLREPLPVDAVRRHGVEGVGDEDDPRAERDRSPERPSG